MRFRYAIYRPGAGSREERGTLEADSEAAAEHMLWERQPGCVIVSLEHMDDVPPPPPNTSSEMTLRTLFPTFFGVRPAQIGLFTRHLAALMASGVGLLPSLQVLREQAGGALGAVLDGIIRDVQSGYPFSQAIARQGSAFPPFYERMVRVGETAGNLDIVLRQIALYMEKEQSVRQRVQRAMAYPAFIFAASILVVVIILTFALPTLTNLYSQFKVDLPPATRLLISVTALARTNGPTLVLLATVAALAFILAAQTENGRLAIDRAVLRLPMFGSINVRGILARYTRTLSLLLRAGLPLVDIMQLVESTVGNMEARRALAAVRRDVLRGQLLSAAIANQPLFPRLLAQMVRVGEETGRLEDNLEAVANLYEEETDRAINNLTGVLEPALTIAMGLLVAFIALSTILPIYGIMRHIR